MPKSKLLSQLGARLLVPVFVGLPGLAAAHGINGHVHVTGWAIESLPPGPLRAFFDDAALRDTAQSGASFPDSGYAVDDAYGEMAHWEPFIEAYVRWIKATHGPDFSTDEARRHIAFMMGAASHGLQDEIFDTIFLRHLEQEDGQSQDAADPGTDAFLFTDGWLRFKPPVWLAPEDLQEVFDAAHGYRPEAMQMRAGMARVKALVIDGFHVFAPQLDAQYRPLLPWGAAHYMDPETAGGHASEIPATRAYMEALWDRLHDRLEPRAVVSYQYPGNGRPVPGLTAGRVESWVHLVFGVGTNVGSLTPETVSLLRTNGEAREPVPVEVLHTRWSGSPDSTTRLLQLRPETDLVAGATYVLRLEAGLWMQDGRTTDAPIEITFTASCPEGSADCTPVPHDGPWDPPLVPWDAAVPDADLPVADAGVPEPDATTPADAANLPADATIIPADAAMLPDGEAPSAPPREEADASTPTTTPSGGSASGCSQGPVRTTPWAPFAVLLLAPARLLRRRFARRMPRV